MSGERDSPGDMAQPHGTVRAGSDDGRSERSAPAASAERAAQPAPPPVQPYGRRWDDYPQHEREVELIDYIEVLLRHKSLIIGGTVLCVLAAVAYSLRQPQVYQAEALVVVSPAIVSARAAQATGPDQGGSGPPGTELTVPAMAVQTYQVLAKSDELMHALADTLIRRLGTAEPGLLQHLAGLDPSAEGLGYGLLQGLEVELVKATEKAKSPLLALRYASSDERLPVLVVNTWSEMFLKRHQGLSSNVTEDFYPARTEMDLKSAKLDASLQAYQQAQTELEDKERQLAHVDAGIAGLEHEGQWMGYLPAAEVAGLSEPAGAPPLRGELMRLVRGIAQLEQDNLAVVQEQQRRTQAFDAEVAERWLGFERDRGIARVRALRDQLDATVAKYRSEAATTEEILGDIDAELTARREELAKQPPVLVVAKAVTDDQVWAQVNRGGLPTICQGLKRRQVPAGAAGSGRRGYGS
ncbi:MAG: Wzz/FepE/Etk N-terminal domain-containing protein [Candidatus Latescibacterota bacterium]